LREVALRWSRLAGALGLVLGFIALSPVHGVAADGRARAPILLASLVIGEPEDFKEAFDEIEPRADLKSEAAQFPILDNSRKGDPILTLRPAFETRFRGDGAVENR